MKLTEDQIRAVTASGSVAVTAGAGTGKTAMLAMRYTHHVVDHKLSPLEIVAVTFTDKAAAELRSRIREEMQKVGDDKLTAEVDAAQISTIHSLAARICRDFYDLAGIPADFSMIDETESAIRSVGWFRDAISSIDSETINQLGYSWLTSALKDLFKDPISSAEALELGDLKWRSAIEAARCEAVQKLLQSSEWNHANVVLNLYSGAPDDKLEAVRQNVLYAMDDLSSGSHTASSFEAFSGFRSNGGAAKNWSRGGLDEVRTCLVNLRDAFKVAGEAVTLEYGDAETDLVRRLDYLKSAFDQARNYITDAKLREKFLDFSDLEYYALKVLENEHARRYYAVRWRALLVDEFQDTNPVQEKLLRHLKENIRLTVVGDEKQSIYGFRRADIEIFGRFREEIGESVNLSRSFRTHNQLVLLMNSIFSDFLGDLHQELEAERIDQPHEFVPIQATVFSSEAGDNAYSLRRAEADYIADEIRRMLTEQMPVFDKRLSGLRPIRPGDIALLSRARGPLDVYIDALLKAGIPAVNTGGGNLLETRVAKDALAVLDFAADPTNDIALVTILRSPFFAISDRVLFDLSRKKKKDQTWWGLIDCRGDLVKAHSQITRLLSEAKSCTPVQLLELIDEMTGYSAVISNLSQGSRRMADWQGILALLRRFAGIGKSDILGSARYARQLVDAEAEIARPPIDAGDAVSLMTIHGSKGLEWPVVFIPDLARQKPNTYSTLIVDNDLGVAFDFERPAAPVEGAGNTIEFEKADPSILRLLKQRRRDREMEEAKRVRYVAITRARDRVFLTAAGVKGPDLDFLTPGLEGAGIVIERIDAGEFRSRIHTRPVSSPGSMKEKSQFIFQIEPVPASLRSIPVTALTEYSVCPRKFRLKHVDGHPGLGEGGATARTIGTLTHMALELGLTTVEGLRPVAGDAADELQAEAIRLAQGFNTNEAFASVRDSRAIREEPVTLILKDITMSGSVDLVGDDFVLDYKTDSEMDPEFHRFQLWAYAKALDRPKALLAYLRHNVLHEFGPDHLENVEVDALKILSGIGDGNYEPIPSEKSCGYCTFQKICNAAIVVRGT